MLPPLQRPLTDDPATAYTLSSEYYLSAAIFEREKQQIFYRSWQYVAPESTLREPGDYATLRICDENVFVIRSDDGELRAFYNICRHRAHELLKAPAGRVKNLLVCPYHAWSYDTRGELRRAPMSEHREGFDNAGFCLHPVRLEVFCGFVFVNLDEDCSSLATLAADLEQDIRAQLPDLDELQPAPQNEQADALIDAGWKVIVDNYVECYHCRAAHPDFASIIDMDAYRLDVFDYWSRQLGPRIRTQNSAYPLSGTDGYAQSAFWFLWPNTTFNLLPGPGALNVSSIRPLGIDRCDFSGHSLIAGDRPYQPRSDYINTILVPEDVDICESVQRGLKSRSYDQGAYMVDPQRSGESEIALHHFHRLVQAALSAP